MKACSDIHVFDVYLHVHACDVLTYFEFSVSALTFHCKQSCEVCSIFYICIFFFKQVQIEEPLFGGQNARSVEEILEQQRQIE